jgi:hypothetical protein
MPPAGRSIQQRVGGGFVYRVGELIVDTDATDLVARLVGQPGLGAPPSTARR